MNAVQSGLVILDVVAGLWASSSAALFVFSKLADLPDAVRFFANSLLASSIVFCFATAASLWRGE